MGTVTYLETGSVDPRYNLAFEEYILRNRKDGDYLLLWQNENTVVIGQNQNAMEEVNLPFVEAHHVSIVRRSTGGGAVYHDLGNLNYSFITDAENADRQTMLRFTEPIVTALRSLGLDANAAGRNDILVDGRKVSGTAQRLYQGRILHHGTLLFSVNKEMMARTLNADPEKFQSKSAKSVRSRTANIKDFLAEETNIGTFWAYLKESLTDKDYVIGSLSDDELEQIEELKREKYDTWEWNIGRSPKCTLRNKRRWSGGSLEVVATVERGTLADIAFYGDFLSLCPLDGLCAALKGVNYAEEAVCAVLDRFPLAECFGSITREQVLTTMFDIGKSRDS